MSRSNPAGVIVVSNLKLGPLVTGLIVAGVALIFVLNREPGPSPGAPVKDDPAGAVTKRPALKPLAVRETPIGDDVIKNHIQVAAVWLPSVGMAGMPEPSTDVIHVEADVRATADNPNGFAKDEFVPYLKVHYKLLNAAGKALDSGDLLPMVAADGLHYGANISRPAPGTYRLVYAIEPPSSGGLGRHADPATGVAPWWEPFEVSFDWTMEPDRLAGKSD